MAISISISITTRELRSLIKLYRTRKFTVQKNIKNKGYNYFTIFGLIDGLNPNKHKFFCAELNKFNPNIKINFEFFPTIIPKIVLYSSNFSSIVSFIKINVYKIIVSFDSFDLTNQAIFYGETYKFFEYIQTVSFGKDSTYKFFPVILIYSDTNKIHIPIQYSQFIQSIKYNIGISQNQIQYICVYYKLFNYIIKK